MPNINIDETSLKILALLQENSRISYTEIGKKIGMTSSSVKERVQKLEEAEIITQYTIKINNEKLGYPIIGITSLSCSGAYTQREQAIVDMLASYHQVLEVLRVTGKTDIIIKFCARTMEECKEITDKLGKYGQIETGFVVTNFINNAGININQKLKEKKLK